MVRQYWIHMLEEDEPELLAAVEAAAPGIVVAPSRFVRGDPQPLLRGELAGLEFPSISTRESHRLIFHREASKVLVAHPIAEGPIAGALSIDTALSDCLVLVRPSPNRGYLEPSRLLAHTHVMRAEKKLRKSPTFSVWVGAVLRHLRSSFPATAVDFIHLAPRARAWAAAGPGQLSYLYQPVAATALAQATHSTTPQKR